MADFDLSLAIRSDGSQAATDATKTASAVKGVGTAAKQAATGTLDLTAAMNAAAVAQGATARTANDATAAMVREASAANGLSNAVNNHTRASNDNAKAMNNQRYAIRNVGQQVGDFGLQVASGQDVARAFGQQIGQLGYAMSEMGGTAGKVGGFLVGPWGIALTIAAAVLAPFIEKLLSANSAAEAQQKLLDKAASAADSYGNAQSNLGKVIDLTTGKMKTQNSVLIQAIKLQAQFNLETANAKIAASGASLGITGGVSFDPKVGQLTYGGLGGGNIDAAVKSSIAIAAQQKQVDAASKAVFAAVNNSQLAASDPQAYSRAIGVALDTNAAKLDRIAVAGKIAGKNLTDVKLGLIGLANAGTDKAASLESLSVLAGGPIPDDLKPYSKDKKARAAKKPKVDSTTPREVEEIQRINEEYDKTPTLIDKAAQATRNLDKIIADLSKRKPPGFEKIIADAQLAKQTIQDGMTKPLDDYVRSQHEALEVQRLLVAGRVDEADALKIVQSLQKQMGPLTADQKDEVLETVLAMREEARQIDIMREKNQKYLTSLGGIKAALQDATTAFVKGDLGSLLKAPGRILDTFQQLQGQKLYEKLFGSTFRDLEDEINGTAGIRASADKMAKSVDTVTASSDKVTAAFDRVAESATKAASAGINTPANDNAPYDENADIVVQASKIGKKPEESAVDFYNRTFGKLGGSIDKSLGEHLGGDFFSKLGSQLGNVLQTASFGSQIGGLFGGRGSSIGASLGGLLQLGANATGLGGGLASFAAAAGPYAPLAQLAMQAGSGIFDLVAGKGKQKNVGSTGFFGLLGGALGGLFATTKRGGALVTSATGAPQIFGNDATTQANAGSLAGSVQSGIKSIADALGGTLGQFAVSIGYFGDKLRVDTSGYTGSLDSKHAPALAPMPFANEAEAIAYAINDAIKDGAVQGLSAAVQKALQSSTDLQTAVNEAVKVQNLEGLLGGVSGALKRTFEQYDIQAKENLRLARAYGLNITEVEKLNADQRVKLVNDTLQASIGSLKDFMTSITTGDLFEGSASDRRTAIKAQIDAILPDAKAGVAGAADKLANLEQQLLQTSRDAFGTAGPEYANDRSNAISAVNQVIQMETDRVNTAAGIQQATTAAVETNNTLTNETNDLLAVSNNTLQQIVQAILNNGGSVNLGNGSILDDPRQFYPWRLSDLAA